MASTLSSQMSAAPVTTGNASKYPLGGQNCLWTGIAARSVKLGGAYLGLREVKVSVSVSLNHSTLIPRKIKLPLSVIP